jgi:uncharacterized membrane protein YhaH (DUF805 family)
MRFRGTLSCQEYAWAAGLRIAMFAAFTVAFPVLLSAFISLGTDVRGAGAFAFVVAIVVKPTAYLVFVLSLLGISVRRLRAAGLPVALAAIIVLLMLGNTAFAVVFAAPGPLRLHLVS